MSFLKSITKTATDKTKYEMQIGYTVRQNEAGVDEGWITYHQGYQFVDADGEPVNEIQQFNAVQGEVKASDLQAANSEMFNGLLAVWNALEQMINAQEGL